MPFIRVKSASKTDPQHEFDVPVDEYEGNKSLYAVVDRVPVPEAREPLYVTTESPRVVPEPAAKVSHTKK